MESGSLRIIFFGTAEFAVPILERLAQSLWRPALVVTTPDAPAGRGREMRAPPVKVAAGRLGVPVIQPEKLSPTPVPLSEPADLFIVTAYGKILPAELLGVPRHGGLNIHPSLLPRWRGASPIQAAILAGDAVTGVTIIQMDAEMDHGPIVAQREFPLGGRAWTAPELADALADLGAGLFLEILEPWAAGRIQAVGQDHSQATYTKPLGKQDGMIDWGKSAGEIERAVRALLSWPGAYTFWQQGAKRVRLVIEEANVRNLESEIQNLAAGAVFEFNGEPGIQCGAGALILKRLKPEGGQAMDGAAFLRGHRDIIGSILS